MLAPSSPRDAALLAAFGVGEILEVALRKPRSAAHHRKFFALMQLVFENQERYDTIADLLVEVKLKCGHYREHLTTKGRLIYVPKSLSFEAMGQEEFGVLYSKAIDVILTHFLPTWGEDDLNAHVDRILGFV